MLILLNFLPLLFSFPASGLEPNYRTDFQSAHLESCDQVFYRLKDDGGCGDMSCTDLLAYQWAMCWKRSMTIELDKQLAKLEKQNKAGIDIESDLQSDFMAATEANCGRSCKYSGLAFKGIPQSYCKVEAFKYRAAQLMQIKEKKLSVPGEVVFPLERSWGKRTAQYSSFTKKLCNLPKELWKSRSRPADCIKKAQEELDGYDFATNVCDGFES